MCDIVVDNNNNIVEFALVPLHSLHTFSLKGFLVFFSFASKLVEPLIKIQRKEHKRIKYLEQTFLFYRPV